ncbi:MAG: rRNA maturation RNase YbeY [Lachnospiraceae bacterium]|nr:rRNA maturation RNase YbeY [Lachnospiraceae bacterium]
MTCLIDCETDINWDFDHLTLYERAVDAVLSAENCPFETVVSLLITDDEGIRQINREKRGIDSPTDVLSFPIPEYEHPADFTLAEEDSSNFDPESGELMLGDIVISQERIAAQAEEYGHDIQREYAFLIVHSMLHLCGYDHIEKEDQELMEERQKIIMAKLTDDFPKLAINR